MHHALLLELLSRWLNTYVAGVTHVGMVLTFALSLLSFTPGRTEASPLYTVTNLGTLGGSEASRALSINALGQVVGYAPIADDLTNHAFLWQNGIMTDLGTLPGDTGSAASGINHSGQVVGGSSSPGGSARAFLWQNGAMIDLGNLGYPDSGARGINDGGQVVGVSRTAALNSRAFLWQNGGMIDLGTLPGGLTSDALGVNAATQVVGFATTVGNTIEHAFLWQNGVMTDLGTLPGGVGFESRAFAINDVGQVVGYSHSPEGRRAVLWDDGTIINLGTLGGTDSVALGINNAGQVVGFSESGQPSPSGGQHAFLWDNGTMIDLNTRLVSGSGNWSLRAAYAISDTGQIVGDGIFEGRQRAFLLTPVADTGPPAITVSANPTTLWPPNGKLVPVTVSGAITDEPDGSGVKSAAYRVTDEYGQIQPSGSMTLGADGSYAFTVALQAARRGHDQDGRHYIIEVSATDAAGNQGRASATVTVRHDQGP